MSYKDIKEDQKKILQEYLNGILDINKSINLTRITDAKQAELLHLEDSLSVLEEINEAPEGLYVDLGSGGGFPGVPLGVITKRNTLLVDSVQKKMNAVQKLINDLDITNIQTYGGRIEELAKEKRNSFSVITARALSNTPSLLELSAPLLIQGGHLVCLKSHISDEELEQSKALEDKLGMKLIKEREYFLSDNETFRKVLVFKKISESKIKLPRKLGKAQKSPLIP